PGLNGAVVAAENLIVVDQLQRRRLGRRDQGGVGDALGVARTILRRDSKRRADHESREPQPDRRKPLAHYSSPSARAAARRAKARVSALRRAGASGITGGSTSTAPPKASATIRPGPSARTWRGKAASTAK